MASNPTTTDPWQDAAELNALHGIPEDAQDRYVPCDRCEAILQRGDLFWAGDDLICDACEAGH